MAAFGMGIGQIRRTSSGPALTRCGQSQPAAFGKNALSGILVQRGLCIDQRYRIVPGYASRVDRRQR